MTAINSNRAIRGPVTAVPVVAGKGVRLVADTENNRWVAEADETVLYETNTVTNNTAGQVFQLSESVLHFERIRISLDNMEFHGRPCTQEYSVLSSSSVFITPDQNGSTPPTLNMPYAQYSINSDGNLVCDRRGLLYGSIGSPQHTNGNYRGYCLMKVVGINRIASN